MRFLKYLMNKYTGVFYFISASLLIIDIFVVDLRAPGELIGTGIFITTLVTSIVNFYFQEEISNQFSIIRESERGEILRIYEHRKAAKDSINKAFKEAHRQIDILCVAGGDCFATTDCIVLSGLEDRCRNDANNIVRILLLDPRSKHAVERGLREDGVEVIDAYNYPWSHICNRITSSLRQLENLIAWTKNNQPRNVRLDVRTYDTAPMLFMMHVDGRVFVEQYHYGMSRRDQQSVGLTRILAKKVPVIEVSAKSTLGELVLSHFDYVWHTSQNRNVGIGFCDKLEKELRDDLVWKKVYEEMDAISRKYLTV